MQNISEIDKHKNILIISYGPVPTPQFQKIEGGGMRAWGLATGLKDNGHNVTVSIFEEFKQDRLVHDGIQLHNWALNDDFKQYINSFDTVIVSYNMGDPSVFVASHLSHHITLVLDCYVPIYIEISARDSDDKAGELRGYLHEIKRFNKVLERGDYFLCANEPQKHMYAGILGSLGVINPYTYHQNRVLVVPFGVDTGDIHKVLAKKENPYTAAKPKGFVLLWFGGLYPWFNFKPLIDSVKELSMNPNFKLYLVGGKNPYNNHPDFVKQYHYVLSEFEKLGLVNKSVFFVDWIDFDDRLRWYDNANLVVSINSPGEENVYSWRTRVMDYLWGELPMMSNGGDPLSDELIRNNAAIEIGLKSDEIVEKIKSLMSNPAAIEVVRKNLVQIKQQYYWPKVTHELSVQLMARDNLPYLDSLVFMEQHKIDSSHPVLTSNASHTVKKVALKARSYAARAKRKGIKRSLKFAASIAKAQVSARLGMNDNEPQRAYFISHPIDHTGAPLVLLDIIKDFEAGLSSKQIRLVAPAIEKDLLNGLLTQKIKIHKMADGIGGRIIQAGLQIRKSDFVLMNTVAVYENYRTFIYWMLESNRLNKAHWFIHEDNPHLRFGNKPENSRIKNLLSQNKLKILVPSKQTAKEYNEFFETTHVQPVSLRVTIPAKLSKPRKSQDFKTIKFFMSGIPLDGRKGQLLFLAALQEFERIYKAKNMQDYRPYTLDLVAIGDDYISKQIVSIGNMLLGEDLHVHPIVSRDKALHVASKCNVTVCSSLNETFALFVAEGMLMGHPVLRNNTSGWQEQMIDGKNGYMFNTLDLSSQVEAIRRILSKNLSNDTLQQMGAVSQDVATRFSTANYYKQLVESEDA